MECSGPFEGFAGLGVVVVVVGRSGRGFFVDGVEKLGCSHHGLGVVVRGLALGVVVLQCGLFVVREVCLGCSQKGFLVVVGCGLGLGVVGLGLGVGLYLGVVVAGLPEIINKNNLVRENRFLDKTPYLVSKVV